MAADPNRQRGGATLVVGVGASAAALPSVEQLVDALPRGAGIAFVLIQPGEPRGPGFAGLLGAPAGVSVVDAEPGVALAPDTVYAVSPDAALAVAGGRFERATSRRGVALPVDHLLCSLARDYGPRAVGVLLSGADSDGCAGLFEIRTAGGLAIAQDPATAPQPIMPQSAIDIGAVDLVLSLDQIPAALERFAGTPPDPAPGGDDAADHAHGDSDGPAGGGGVALIDHAGDEHDGDSDDHAGHDTDRHSHDAADHDGDSHDGDSHDAAELHAEDRRGARANGGGDGGDHARGVGAGVVAGAFRERDEPADARWSSPERRPPLDGHAMARIAALLEAHASFDLRVYKPTTIGRRLLRRMAITGFSELDAYLAHLRRDAAEQRALVRDLLIRVTGFFRDPQAFDAIRAMALEPLVDAAGDGDTLRAWIPGCATGQEAYSVAIELLDAVEARGKSLPVQVFATDIDHDALDVGRAGVYPLSIADQVSEARLRKYFTLVKGRGYRVRPALRDVVSFAAHDLCKDPPFSRMGLVSCRNVLIYLRSLPQEHVLKVLHFALQPDGYLILGSSESVGAQRALFATLSKKWRVYRKVGTSRPLFLSPGPATHFRDSAADGNVAHELKARPVPRRDAGPGGLGELARRAVMQARVPPTIVVSGTGDVVFMHGELRPYLRFPDGDPRFDLASVVTPDLATRARGTLYKCRRDRETVVAFSSPDAARATRTKITATPCPELGDGAVILTFESVGAAHPGADAPAATADAAAVADTAAEGPTPEPVLEQLEAELRATREDLRNTVDELESSNEQLRASHEQSMSMNEELQSANEELEATTEELRALNEELTTVNAQLREKVEQLEQAHDDLSNFIASTKIATLFLDHRLCIVRFTPSAEDLLRIDHTHAGRFIGDIARELLQNELDAEARDVLEHLSPRARDLPTKDGRWVARRILPYRAESRRVDGVVVTFVDITKLKRATELVAVRERQHQVLARLGLYALEEPDIDSFLDRVVREVQHTLRTDRCTILELQPGRRRLLMRAGVGWDDGVVGRLSIAADMTTQAGFTLSTQAPVIVEDLLTERRFPGGATPLAEHGVRSGLSCVIGHSDTPYGVLSAHTCEPRVFTAEDTHFLQAVATIIGAALGRHQTRIQLALEGAAARAVAEATGLDELIEHIHAAFTRELGTAIGELWRPDPDAPDGGDGGDRPLRCTLLAVSPPFRHDAVAREFCRDSAAPGSMAHRVFVHRRAEWVSSLQDEADFPRVDAARRLGITSGLALPIVTRDEVLGVMVVFSSRHLYADDVLLRCLEGIGRSLGEFARRAEAERTAHWLASIAESSQDAISSYAFDGTVTAWLHGAEQLYGYSAAEMLGGSIDRVVPDDRRAELRGALDRVRRGELVEPFETVRVRKDGSTVAVSVRISPARDAHGQLVGVSAIGRDNTEQVRVAEALAASERRFRGTFDNAAVGIAHTSPDGRWLRVNDRLLEITGYSREELLGGAWQDITHPDDLDRDLYHVQALINGRVDEYRSEKRYFRKDGTVVWVNLTTSVVKRPPDEPEYFISVIEDISARKQAEEELRDSEWRFRQVLIHSPVPMLLYDHAGTILAVSKSWSEVSGYEPDDMPTLDAWLRRAYGDDSDAVVSYLQDEWDADAFKAQTELEILTKSGARRTLLFSAALLGQTRDGRRLRICAAADVTPQKRAERELVEASRQKDEFLAMLGHELRNPLAAVRSAAELLKLTHPADPKLQRTQAILERQSAHMARLLDGLLDISRIIRGKITLDRRPIDLRDVLRDVVADHAAAVDAARIDLRMALPDAPLRIEADPVRMTQIVDNLLSNAIKYTLPGGAIELGLWREGAVAVLSVRDDGMGIDADLLPHIFEVFRQAKQSLDRSQGGLGLGLSLVKSLVELHGGGVQARSAGPGCGAEFTVRLPLARAAPVPRRATTGDRAASRILLVEDNEDAAEMLRAVLELKGHEVLVATRGRQAVDMARDHAPDVVLCDLGLPGGMTGYDVALALRADPATRDILLVAVSGYGRPEDKARSAEAGFHAHLTKPVDIAAVERAITGLQSD